MSARVAVLLWALAAGAALAATTGRLEVRVVEESGEPAAGVLVTATEGGTNRKVELRTNAKGKALFMSLAGGEVFVRVEKEGCQIVEKNAQVQVGTTASVEATLVALRRVLTEEELSPEQLAAKRSAAAYNTAVARFQAGDYDSAWKGVEEALALEPGLAPAFLLKARLLSKRDDHGAAADAYIHALELDPALTTYLPNLIGELQLARRVDEAAIHTAKLEGLPAETPDQLYELALVKINAGDDEVGLALIERILAAAPDHALSYYQRGLIRLRRGATLGTLEDMRRYLELEPNGRHAKDARGFIAALSK